MHKEMPSKIRSIVQNAIMQFKDGKVSRSQIDGLLRKHFSNKTFDNMLACVQGDLNKCKQVDLEKWAHKANEHVDKVAHVAQKKAEVIRDKKKA